MNAKFLKAGATIFILTACSINPPTPEQKPQPASAELEAQWRPYHYYVVDKRIEWNFSSESNGFYSGALAHENVRYVLKALTPEGSSIGNLLQLSGFRQYLESLNIDLEDAEGREIHLDKTAIIHDFQETGKLVIPNVTDGCTLYLEFRNGPFTGFYPWELNFNESVPVYRASFQFGSSEDLGYDFKAYNGLKLNPGLDGSSEKKVWSSENILPFSMPPFGDYSTARPKLVIVARKTLGEVDVRDWKAAIKSKVAANMTWTLFGSESQCHAKAMELAAGKETSWRAALAIFGFIRDSLTEVDHKKCSSADHVLEVREGNRWEIAMVLQTMLNAIGLDADILLARGRSSGGFDESFSQTNSLQDPLVTFAYYGVRYVAYPESHAFSLGDYPTDYFGLSAASAKVLQTQAIPKPIHPVLEMTLDQKLTGEGEREIRLRTQGPMAAHLRGILLSSENGGLPGLQQFMRQRFGQLQIHSYTAEGLEDPEQPLELILKTDNPRSTVSRGEGSFVSWAGAFSSPFWFYDSLRTDAYYFPVPVHLEESFQSSPVDFSKVFKTCEDVRTQIFRVHCWAEEAGEGGVAHRTVDIFPGRYSPEAWRSENERIVKLNDERFSW